MVPINEASVSRTLALFPGLPEYVRTASDQKLGAGRPAKEANAPMAQTYGTQTVSLSHVVRTHNTVLLSSVYAMCGSFESEM